MLKVEHVTFRYERRGAPVLRDASLSLETGQVGVLLGRNGCGKTTLLKTPLGLCPPEQGQILFDGQALGAMKRQQRAQVAAYVPQELQFGALRVYDAVLAGRVSRFGIQPGAADRTVAEAALADMDLTALAGVRSRVRAKDLFEMRLIFEPATVALACQRATDEELRQIKKKADRMERIAAEGGDWPLADQEFHWAIIKASHNEYMRRLYPIINSAVNEIMQLSQNRQHMQNVAISDNQQILYFLMRRDEAGARHAMSIHMRHLLHILQS